VLTLKKGGGKLWGEKEMDELIRENFLKGGKSWKKETVDRRG